MPLNHISNTAPQGTKMFILDLGTLEADAAWVLKGGNTGTKEVRSPPEHAWKKLSMYAVLIDHPKEGLILFETGPGPGVTGTDDDYEKVWGAAASVFCRINPDLAQELPAAIKKTGHDIKDIKHVVMGHLHLDHAGGLVHFKGRRDVTIWAHEIEIKHAFWGVTTGVDSSYLPHYLDLALNWKSIDGEMIDLFQGITMMHLNGHTPGLMAMNVNLPVDGPFLFTSDHFHIMENYTDTHIQGWLARDSDAWYRSTQRVKSLENNTGARIVPGHDYTTVRALLTEKSHFA